MSPVEVEKGLSYGVATVMSSCACCCLRTTVQCLQQAAEGAQEAGALTFLKVESYLKLVMH